MTQLGVHFNPSTLKAQYNNDTGKVIVSSYEYGADSCCFLDPDTPDWDAETTYNLGDIVESHTSTGTYRSKVDNNLNHAVTDTSWWTKISNAASCGNPDWNKWPGYGGVGKTPKYLRVKITGLSLGENEYCGGNRYIYKFPAAGPNRTYIVRGGSNCWGCSTPRGAGGWYEMRIALHDVGWRGHVSLEAFWSSVWAAARIYETGEAVDIDPEGDGIFGVCLQNHTSTAENKLGTEGGVAYWAAAYAIYWWKARHYEPGTAVYIDPEDAGPFWVCLREHNSTAENEPGTEGGAAYWASSSVVDDVNICNIRAFWVPSLDEIAGWVYDTSYQTGQHVYIYEKFYKCIQTSWNDNPYNHPDYWTEVSDPRRANSCELGFPLVNWGGDMGGHAGNVYGAGLSAKAYITPGCPRFYNWNGGVTYGVGNMVYGTDNNLYVCKLGHTSSTDDWPTTGVNWQTYWDRSLGCS